MQPRTLEDAKKISNRISSSLRVFVVAFFFVAAPPASAQDAAVRQTFDRYIESVNGADLTIASQIWSHTTDVIVVTPFGRFAGWDAVQKSVYVDFLKNSFTERKLQPSNVAVVVNGDTAWLTFDWTFSGKMTANGQTIASKGWESHVYRKGRDGWRIVQLHYSVPPPPQ
ncbi:MAG TPA: nuclear transport factor 2 family protein [Vicinamibacterales bacterium]|nr:nuclear transport factor 2 family protein [Vicinamibacterales bacterium]